MIWMAMFIPFITIGLLLWKFSRKITPWEYGLILGVPLLAILISKGCIETFQTSDDEYWGGHVLNSEYYESWDEKVSCRHPRYETYTDSNGNTHTRFVGYDHAYDVDWHQPYWVINTTIGAFHVPEDRFSRLVHKFGNKTFVDLHRRYYSKDGDKCVAVWKNDLETLEPVTTIHSYCNKVQASNSVFNFKEVNPKDFGLFEYPKVNSEYKQRSIIGNGGADHIQAETKLDYFNATLGNKKQVRMFVLVFKNQPLQAAFDQENYWKGGNKNEFITCIGVDDSLIIQWAHIFSWSEVEDLKIDARDQLEKDKPLELVKYVEWLGTNIEERFKRKSFTDFDYLSVDPPMGAIIFVYLLTIAICIGIGVWAVRNELDM
jgi:hypothetical protein